MNTRTPIYIGCGLICLDAVLVPDGGPPRLFAGGTSLNIAAILAQKGWYSHVVGRIGDDYASRRILHDLDSMNVQTRMIERDADTQTPVYVETIESKGHRFHRQCPDCGADFPSCVPNSDEFTHNLIGSLPETIDAACFERDFTSCFQLARACKDRGALIYVELNRMTCEDDCLHLLELADIFKYARDRCGLLPDDSRRPSVPLEIETLGSDGVRYRVRRGEWKRIPALHADQFIDAAGSGDWVSATLIHHLTPLHRQAQLLDDAGLVENALNSAQNEAVLNGKFYGARGRLYEGRTFQQANSYCPCCLNQSTSYTAKSG
ncbi:MAG: hypothetical protein GC154_00190 [bacterium]|nr:hypothetical protein [bacterium]